MAKNMMAMIDDSKASEIAMSGCEVLGDGHEDERTAALLSDLRAMLAEHGLKAVLEGVRDAADCSADAVEGGLFEDDGSAQVLRAIAGHVSSAAKVIK